MSHKVLDVAGIGKSYRHYHSEWRRIAGWTGLYSGGYTDNWVLRDVSFSLEKGEAVGVMGQNGAGKSTLLKLITGITRPTEGHVRMEGRIAALLELGIGFNPEFTGRENARHSAGLMGFSADEIEQMLPEIEEFADIGDYFDQPLRVYSSGMQVRVAFATATAVRPDILIVDEALSVGDAAFQAKCFQRIRDFRTAGTTLLIVSHDLHAILSICDRAILLDRGRKLMEGPPQEVYDFYYATVIESSNDIQISHQQLAGGKKQLIYGNGKTELVETRLLNARGEPTDTLEVGEEASLLMQVRANADLPALVAAYVIKDRLGHYIYGVNTHDLKNIVNDVRSGEVIEYNFTFDASIGAGDYTIAIALMATQNMMDDCFEWRGPAMIFSVVNTSQPPFIGHSWLPPSLSVNRIYDRTDDDGRKKEFL